MLLTKLNTDVKKIIGNKMFFIQEATKVTLEKIKGLRTATEVSPPIAASIVKIVGIIACIKVTICSMASLPICKATEKL